MSGLVGKGRDRPGAEKEGPRDVEWFVRRAEEYRRRREEPLDAAYRDEAMAYRGGA